MADERGGELPVLRRGVSVMRRGGDTQRAQESSGTPPAAYGNRPVPRNRPAQVRTGAPPRAASVSPFLTKTDIRRTRTMACCSSSQEACAGRVSSECCTTRVELTRVGLKARQHGASLSRALPNTVGTTALLSGSGCRPCNGSRPSAQAPTWPQSCRVGPGRQALCPQPGRPAAHTQLRRAAPLPEVLKPKAREASSRQPADN